ncbi:MAG: hypothetical protein OEY05_15470, partial [Paracoccaceae bacterium]|nr:hypothetical protein [Paracoccaceae bacterium]
MLPHAMRFTTWRSTTSAVNATHGPVIDRRGFAGLAGGFGCGMAPGCASEALGRVNKPPRFCTREKIATRA